MLTSILNGSSVNIDLMGVLVCSVIEIILGIVIALTYKNTSKYSKNFLITLTLLPLFVGALILMVNGNLGMGVAIAGIFGLVRFRSIPGTSKEIISVLFAMAIGVACGVGYVVFGACLTVIGCLLMLILGKTKIYEESSRQKYLKITIPEDLDYTDVFDDILGKFTNSYKLEQVKTTNLGSMFELKYNINLKSGINEKQFIDELRVRNGNLKIALTQPTDTMDL